MSKKKTAEKDSFVCPVGKFFMTFERKGEKKSEFFEHLSKSRIEFLRAVRSLVDDQIERLEKKERPTTGERMTKIEVE
jgi:hypothetical protein